MAEPPLELIVDPASPAEQSVVLRYAGSLFAGLLGTRQLAATSRGEGMRLLDLGEVGGVRLWALDETTRMASGTYKSMDGCITTALAVERGWPRIAFSSGANAGSALSLYAQGTRLETFFFCPTASLGKLDGGLFERPPAHLIAVDGSDRRVKEACRRFGELTATPVVPPLEWRMLSAACRGLFLAEHLPKLGIRFAWMVQSVCAGYGPIGLYRAWERLAAAGQFDLALAPRFLGIQQAGLCPMVAAWNQGLAELPALTSDQWAAPPIEPALYNVYPDQTYPQLRRLLDRWGGAMLAVEQAQFDRHGETFARLLEAAGVPLTRLATAGNPYLEKAGLLAGAGALAAIGSGQFAAGDHVLCLLTGGAGPAPRHPARPDRRIGLDEPLDDAIAELAAAFVDSPTRSEASP